MHAVDHAVSCSLHRCKTLLLLEPVEQSVCRRFVVGGFEREAVLLLFGRVMKRQIGPAHADPVDRSVKPARQMFVHLVERKLDARRAAIDRQYGWFSRLRD